MSELELLPSTGIGIESAPYLEVRVLLEGPEPGLRHKVETALIGKHIRLAKIDVKYPDSKSQNKNSEFSGEDQLQDLVPAEVFSKLYQSKYNSPVPETIQLLFNQVTDEVAQIEQP